MKQHGLTHIPVVEQDASRPLGVLYARDVVQALLKDVQDEELLLRDYVMSVGYH
jgi:CBS domain-containing protein